MKVPPPSAPQRFRPVAMILSCSRRTGHRRPPVRSNRFFPPAWLLLILAASPIAIGTVSARPELFEWERGFGLRQPGAPGADMYFWIYEWNMFEAMKPGQHTHGTYKLSRKLSPDRTEAIAASPEFHLTLRLRDDGADLLLRVTNRTDRDWPEIAGVIPCWNPGQVAGTNPSMPLPLNRNFADPWRRNTFYISAGGLTPLDSRAIHFNARLRSVVDQASDEGRFVFSPKWPTSSEDATAGLLVRESEDGRWVTGVAWEEFLSVQGHNPWSCLHACVRIGPLPAGGSREIRGRLYLFKGTKEECTERFRRDFPPTP